MQLANTPAKAHMVISRVKTVNRYGYLMALCFVLVELERYAANTAQKMCLKEAAMSGDPDLYRYPLPCLPQLIFSGPVLFEVNIGMIWETIVRQTLGFLVSYFVTVLALVDQMLLIVFMLWEHDGYMADDRQIHELSFLYANSLYDIRRRAESLLSTCESFLITGDRSRISWINKLEQYHAAFGICDSSGDGNIQQEELGNLLRRMTADSATASGLGCQCKACADWSKYVTTVGVDWEKFKTQFDVSLLTHKPLQVVDCTTSICTHSVYSRYLFPSRLT